MKNIASTLVMLGIVLLVASSCFFSETSDETATIKLVIANDNRATYDCYAVNVVGPGIKSFDPRYPIPTNQAIIDPAKYCHYPGISSRMIGLQNGEASLEVGVPIGAPRLVQVIGMNLSSGFSECPAGTFSEVWKGKIDDKVNNFSEIDNDQIYEVGRKVLDLRPGMRELAVTIDPLTTTPLNQFGATYCDPPTSSGGAAGGLTFTTFTTNVFSKRSLKNYLSPNQGVYDFVVSDGVSSYSPTDDTITLGSSPMTFGAVSTDLSVSVTEQGTGKTGSGTIRVRGNASDPSLYFWLTNDKVYGTFSSWQSLKGVGNGLDNMMKAGTTTLLTSDGPYFVPVAKFDANSGHLAATLGATGETWDRSAFFVVFKMEPAPNNRIFCYSRYADECVRPPSTPATYVVVRSATNNGNTVLEIEGCIDCNITTTSKYAVLTTPSFSDQFYVLGIALNGASIRYSLSSTGSTATNRTGPLPRLGTIATSATGALNGNFVNNNVTPPGGFYLGKGTNDKDLRFAEAMIYRHVESDPANFDIVVPCSYFNAKYGANLNCSYLNATP